MTMSKRASEESSGSVWGKNTFSSHSIAISLLVHPFFEKATCQPGCSAKKVLLKPLLLDTLVLEDDQGLKNVAKRRDTLYYRGPSTGIYCPNWYSIRVLLRGAFDKSTYSLAFHNAAFVGVVPVSVRNPGHGLVQVE